MTLLANFFQTVVASAIGFVIAKVATAWFDANVSHAKFLEDERNADVQELRARVSALKDTGLSYWMSDRGDEDSQIEALILSEINGLGVLIGSLFGNVADLNDACQLELDRLDDALTYGDFRSERRKAEEQRVSEIYLTTDALQSKVRSCRRKLKPKWLWQL